MVLTKFTPCQELYNNHYCQNGGNIAVFEGSLQHGHGIGGVIAGLARMAIPLLSKTAKTTAIPMLKKAGKHALSIGVDAASKVLMRKMKPKDAAKQSAQLLGKRIAEIIQSDIAPKKRKRKPTKKRKRKVNDIFD